MGAGGVVSAGRGLIGNGLGGSCSPQLVGRSASGSSLLKAAVREGGGLLAKAGNARTCGVRVPLIGKGLSLGSLAGSLDCAPGRPSARRWLMTRLMFGPSTSPCAGPHSRICLQGRQGLGPSGGDSRGPACCSAASLGSEQPRLGWWPPRKRLEGGAGTSWATIGVANHPDDHEEVPDGKHGRWVGSASTPDHLRVRRYRLRRVVAGQVVAARPSTLPPLAEPGGGRPSPGQAGGVGGGGLHRLAVRGRGDHLGRLCWRIWPSLPTPWPRGDGNVTPKRTAPTLLCCASCSKTGICPRAGFHRRSYWSGENECACTRRWSISAPSGGSASTPSATSMGWPSPNLEIRTEATRSWLLGDTLELDRRCPATDWHRLFDDPRHRHPRPAPKEGTHPLRGTPAGLPGLGGRPLRHRRTARVRQSGPSWATAGASPAQSKQSAIPAWTSPSTNRIASASRVTSPVKDPRSCAGRSTRRPRTPPTRSPRPPLLRAGSKRPTTARSQPSRSPASWPVAATTPCGPSTPRSSTPWPNRSISALARSFGRDRPQQTPGSRDRKLPTPACLPALVLDGL